MKEEQLGEENISVSVACLLPLPDEEEDEPSEVLVVEAERGEEAELVEVLRVLLADRRPPPGVRDGPASSVSPLWWRSR